MTETFLNRLELSSDLELMRASLSSILEITDWAKLNQIGLNYRSGAADTWHDGAGSLYNASTGNHFADEHDFDQWNDLPEYLRGELTRLSTEYNFNPGRIRFMRLLPKTGLSIHKDRGVRYHYVLKTNPGAVFGEWHPHHENAQCGVIYHLPCDAHWYKINTRLHHFVYNGGATERIHLVVCD